MIIEVISFGLAAVLFLALALVMLTGQRDNPRKRMLAIASFASAVWAGFVTYQAAFGGFLGLTLSLEFARSLSWFGFLLLMLRTAYISSPQVSRNFRTAFAGLSAFIVGLIVLALYRISGGSLFEFIAGNDILVGHLLISIGGIVIVEQLYRNTDEDHKWAMKYLWMAIGSMFAYDFYLYSDALLFQRIDNELWNSRGFIHAMAVPLIGVAIKREMQWSLGNNSIDVFVSRKIVFHTTTLLGAGIYMLVIGIGGYYVREYSGSWGLVAQVTFIFAAGLCLAILLFSGQFRAKLKVLIDKHFFHYKYDYRDEWLRIISTLSAPGENTASRLHERAIRALAQIIDSPGGILFMKRDSGRYEPQDVWNMDELNCKEPADSSFIRFLEEHQFVIRMDEFYRAPEVYTRLAPLEIPDWMRSVENAWLIVPLMLQSSLLGFVILAPSPSHKSYFNWEDSDLLKTVGRQVASYLGQYESAQALASARRFEEANRLSAFIMHDLKNMIGQLSLVVSNADKHKQNPLFIEDAISTVEHSVTKMNRLMARLRGGGGHDAVQQLNLCQLLEEVIRNTSRTAVLPLPVLNCQATDVKIVADRDRMMANIGHIIQNAQEATSDNGSITVRLRTRDHSAVIEVEDTGCGMDVDFIQNRLFQPFESTKGTMGIGVFQVREYIYKLGGDLEVESKPNEGTIFRLTIPVPQADDNVIRRPHLIKR